HRLEAQGDHAPSRRVPALRAGLLLRGGDPSRRRDALSGRGARGAAAADPPGPGRDPTGLSASSPSPRAPSYDAAVRRPGVGSTRVKQVWAKTAGMVTAVFTMLVVAA